MKKPKQALKIPKKVEDSGTVLYTIRVSGELVEQFKAKVEKSGYKQTEIHSLLMRWYIEGAFD
jgi:predicted XRE-type DNA-binding protein